MAQPVEDLATVAAVERIHAQTHGGSRPQIVRLVDGRPALVKLQGNPQTTRALVGELIGTLLGRRVGAAFPEPLLVAIDSVAAARMGGRRCPPGLHFGTLYRPEATPVRGQAHAASLGNLDRLPATALAEAWLYNVDLKRDHVLSARGAGGAELLVVDHGHIFPGGPTWTADQMERHRTGTPSLLALTRVARLAGGPFAFSAAVASCEAVSDDELTTIIARVPAAWGLQAWEAEAIHRFLAGRRQCLASWADKLARTWRSRP